MLKLLNGPHTFGSGPVFWSGFAVVLRPPALGGELATDESCENVVQRVAFGDHLKLQT
jgi:hypothetical protein